MLRDARNKARKRRRGRIYIHLDIFFLIRKTRRVTQRTRAISARKAGIVAMSVTTMALTTRSTLMQVQTFYNGPIVQPTARSPIEPGLRTPEARRFAAWDRDRATQPPHELCMPSATSFRSLTTITYWHVNAAHMSTDQISNCFISRGLFDLFCS